MANLLKSAGFMLIFWSATIYYFLKLFVQRVYCHLVGKEHSSHDGHRVAAQWGKAVLSRTPGWKIKIHGQENIPPEGTGYVIVANHESATDILAIYYLGVQFRWLSKESNFKIPCVGPAMRWCGYVPIQRGRKDSHRQAMADSAEWLRQKVPMLFFPEGTRSVTGKIQPFKSGAFRLALDADVPILPVVLHGAGRLLKKGTVCPYPATVRIEILPLVKSLPGETVGDFAERVRGKMMALHEFLDAASQEAASSPAAQGGVKIESELTCQNRPGAV